MLNDIMRYCDIEFRKATTRRIRQGGYTDLFARTTDDFVNVIGRPVHPLHREKCVFDPYPYPLRRFLDDLRVRIQRWFRCRSDCFLLLHSDPDRRTSSSRFRALVFLA